ncbi:ABC transporter substrate-binding protein [Bacillus sp. JJ1122]|uniref:ABC transporter substrate-binding protein n=1 Tax=Bacillus sp. JJ1122 TaxID=3122951 RepID=UPI002FFE74CE
MNPSQFYYFFVLRKAFQQYGEGIEIKVTMKTLAELFFCTERNAKLIISKLEEYGLLHFQPGRGRGNASMLVFKTSLESCLLSQVQFLLSSNETGKAFEIVKEFGEGTCAEEYILNWTSNYFGYKQANEEGKELEILRFPIYRPITTHDPTRVVFDLDAHLILQVYQPLVQYDVQKGIFTGCLARAWEANHEKTEWLFFLHKGVKFHNGAELTAEIVADSVSRLFDSPHRWLVADVVEAEVISRYTIRFRLEKPNHLFLHFVSSTPMVIVEPDHFTGTGAFKLEKYHQDLCVLSAFEAHFQPRPYFDRVEIIRISDEMKEWQLQQKLSLETGETEAAVEKKWDTQSSIFSGTNVLTVNTAKKGPLQNVSLRRYLSSVIDRDKLVTLGSPRLSPASGFQQDDMAPLEIEIPSQSDVIFSEEKLTLMTYKRHADDAALLQSMLQEHGINLAVEIVDWNEILTDSMVARADLLLFEATPNEGIISILDLILFEKGFIYPFLETSIKQELRNMIDRIKSETSEDVRKELLKKLEMYLASEGVIIFLVHKMVEASYDKELEGVTFTSKMWVDFKNLWFKRIEQS